MLNPSIPNAPVATQAPVEGSAPDDQPVVPAKPFVAISQFEVANGAEMTNRVKQAFRLHLVDHVPGFLRMDVLSPLDTPSEIWLITFWSTEAAFHDWHHGHAYKDAHAGIPAGLKLVRRSFKLRFFEHVSA